MNALTPALALSVTHAHRGTVLLLACLLAAGCTPTPTPQGRIDGVTVTVVISELMPSQTPAPAPTAAAVCADAPPARLIVGERGRVLNVDDRTLNLRSGAGTEYFIVRQLQPGDLFFVLEGPTCADGYAWFRVQAGSVEGWIAEGDPTAYFVEPYLTG